MLNILLVIATALLAAPDPPDAPNAPDAPAAESVMDAQAKQQAAEEAAQQTQRDQLAVAEHVLREAGLTRGSLPRYLFPALVEREAELRAMRHRLADLELQLADLDAQIAEMQAFVLDHDRYGTDFSQYRLVRRQAEQEVRRRAALERRARRQLALQQKEQTKADRDAVESVAAVGKDLQETLRKMNFGLIGQGVWGSRSAYAYARVDKPGEAVNYNPSPFGRTRITSESRTELDWSKMTISGSVLNAAEETRNIGIAFAFFDEHGNQVGAETVVVNNARSGVPYPFTQKLDMAATKPFASSTSWVLFADTIQPPPPAAQAGATTP